MNQESVSLFSLFSPVQNIFLTPFRLRPASTDCEQKETKGTKRKNGRENLLRNA
jgi:hypothetical protein